MSTISKSEFKYIQSLCHKKQRQEEGLFIAEGPKLLQELLQSNYSIQKIYATTKWIENNTVANIEIKEASITELERITSLQNANEVLAIVQQKENILPTINNAISLVLDGIQDPGNLGTIIRIADWFGIQNILCSSNTVELYNAKVIQSTMGSFVRVNIWYGDITPILQNTKLPIFGALLNGKNLYQQIKIKKGFLVIGNEGKGISESILPLISDAITIPKIGGAESLNAAVATGIILSHLI